MKTKQTVAVIGAGAAGLSAAYYLSRRYAVTLFESASRLGGHAHTVRVTDASVGEMGIDIGFIVFNPKTYPLFIQFLEDLGVSSQPSDMAFAYHDKVRDFYYGSDLPSGLFSQKKHWVSPSFWRFLSQIPELNRRLLADLKNGVMIGMSLGQYLQRSSFQEAVLRDYLLPMGAAIWSCPQSVLLDFPAQAFFSFWENHDLLTLSGRPTWRTVTGGSKTYIEAFQKQFQGTIKIGQPVDAVSSGHTCEHVSLGGHRLSFDKVVIATHADQAWRLLVDPSETERSALQPWAYSRNEVVLHTDSRVMPPRKSAWGSWTVQQSGSDILSMSYYMNRLQALTSSQDYFVSLNPIDLGADILEKQSAVFARETMYHPIYSQSAIDTHHCLLGLSGQQNRYFCGSYMGYGFHEDAVRSGVRVATLLGAI